jgi:hypothetical protein
MKENLRSLNSLRHCSLERIDIKLIKIKINKNKIISSKLMIISFIKLKLRKDNIILIKRFKSYSVSLNILAIIDQTNKKIKSLIQ